MASFFRPPRFLVRERGSPRIQPPESRTVICYRCARSSVVSGFAESASCPHCSGNLRLLPIEILKGHWGSSIMTTESVLVHQRAKVIANLIVASNDIVIHGCVHAMCICGGCATLSGTAELRGGIRAKRLIIEPGATIEHAIFESPSTALGIIDVDAASRARPGTGPAALIKFDHDAPPRQGDQPDLNRSRIIEPKDNQSLDQSFLIHPSHPPKLRVVR